jgi:Holliday junction resolvasome RuvABC ATP-dependent DNA helicase subunit
MSVEVPGSVRKLLWDVEPSSVDVQRHARFLIRRVLDFGDVASVNWLRRTYTDAEIQDVVARGRGLAHKTIVFWNLYFRQKAQATGVR